MFGRSICTMTNFCSRTEEFPALYPSLHIIQPSITDVHMSSSQPCSMIIKMLRNRYIHRLRHRGFHYKDASMDVTSDLSLLFGWWECKAGEWTRKSDILGAPPFVLQRLERRCLNSKFLYSSPPSESMGAQRSCKLRERISTVNFRSKDDGVGVSGLSLKVGQRRQEMCVAEICTSLTQMSNTLPGLICEPYSVRACR